ncbi:MAG: L-rhamnose mutarotase [Bacteroidota bacterium]
MPDRFMDDKTNTLFAYVELASEEQWESIAEEPVCQKWWRSMAELMETEVNQRPMSKPLREVFYLA